MNQITGNPNSYDFGLDFNYAVWTPNTRITMVNVPWNNDYRDIVRFANKAALNTYIDGIENSGVVIENVSYAKPSQPVRINIPFNAAAKYNYLRASNQTQPVSGDLQKDYYYFITDVRYIAPNTTEIVVQLDVWQTYGYDVTFGNCYVERGHIGVANSNNFSNYGRDYLTVPEGIDMGNEYKTHTRKYQPIIDSPENAHILVYSTIQLEITYGTTDNPSLHTAYGTKFENMASGASAYVFTYAAFTNFLTYMAAYPWVTQGIVSITVIPQLSRYFPFSGGNWTLELNGGTHTIFGARSAPWIKPETKSFSNWANWRDAILTSMPAKYRKLKKFLTYPYMNVELTSYTGSNVTLKPELWDDASATIVETASLSAPNQRVVIHPGSAYNGELIDTSTQIANFPQLPIVNNAAVTYLASNAHQIAFQRQSADWSQQRAMGSGQTAYDQASANISQMENAARIGRNADIQQTGLSNQVMLQQTLANAAFGIGGGVLTGAATGGGAGAAMGAISGGTSAIQGAVNYSIQSGANTQANAIRNAANVDTTRGAAETGSYVRDTNKQLVDWAARGDYENTIAGINAKVQDANLIAPSMIGQAGGESFNMVNGYFGYALKFKIVNSNAMKVIGDYWLRYGYAVRQFVPNLPANMQCMTKFTYWKLTETYITAAPMPEGFKQAIRGIFEKGVTVWSNPAYIGTTDLADNEALEGITL